MQNVYKSNKCGIIITNSVFGPVLSLFSNLEVNYEKMLYAGSDKNKYN